MRIFVAGATGVLGRALLPLLAAGGHSVRAVARRAPDVAFPAEVELLQADVLADDLVELVRGSDAVIHIATAIPADRSAPGAWDATARLRIDGTRRLLAAALVCGVERYLQQSIVMAYRDGGEAWLDESAPLDDSALRAETCGPVIAMEAMIRALGPQLPGWTILRGGSFVGPGTAQGVLMEQLRRGEVVVAGDGSNYVSPVHVSDMAAGFAAALERAPAARRSTSSTSRVASEPTSTRSQTRSAPCVRHVPAGCRCPRPGGAAIARRRQVSAGCRGSAPCRRGDQPASGRESRRSPSETPARWRPLPRP